MNGSEPIGKGESPGTRLRFRSHSRSFRHQRRRYTPVARRRGFASRDRRLQLKQVFDDIIFIDDVVAANRTLLDTDDADGEAVNIGSTDNIPIKTLAEEIRDPLKPDLELEYAERYDADADHTHADTSKAENLLGYDPDHSVREGVAKFIEWYRENREWYEPLVSASYVYWSADCQNECAAIVIWSVRLRRSFTTLREEILQYCVDR